MTNSQQPTHSGSGGFFPPNNLPSPAPSNQSTKSVAGLPHPRRSALRPGSAKEDMLREFVQERLFQINRRYVKKYGIPEPGDEVVGYKSISELCKDLDNVINMTWLSGTPSLQIPYFLRIANDFNTWLDSFPPSPASFTTLRKLDHCFASLLIGQDIETKEDLPGFVNGLKSGMSRTDMVRCKSIIEQTRILIVVVMGRSPNEDASVSQVEDVTETDGETSMSMDEGAAESNLGGDGDGDGDDDEEIFMDVARVYEHTIVQLGVALGDGVAIDDI